MGQIYAVTKERNISYFFPEEIKDAINLHAFNFRAKWILSVETINPYYLLFRLVSRENRPKSKVHL